MNSTGGSHTSSSQNIKPVSEVHGQWKDSIREQWDNMPALHGQLIVVICTHRHHVGVVLIEVFAGDEAPAFMRALVGMALDREGGLALASVCGCGGGRRCQAR